MGRRDLSVKNIQGVIEPALYGLVSFFVALLVAWVFLAQQNFWYGVWHDYGGIGPAIEKYGPQNRYKPGFAETDREQRIALFGQINKAVHSNGEGLDTIVYKTERFGEQRLLRKPEVIHLQDVANLIGFLRYVVACLVLVWLFLLWRVYKAERMPPLSRQLMGTAAVIALLTAMLFVIGPVTVFNTLHEWVFPKGHPWFFYYQDSLMSTMMKAPLLFGWISIALVVWAVVFHCAIQWCLYRYLMPRFWKMGANAKN